MLPERLPHGERALPGASIQPGSGLPSPVSPLEEAAMNSSVAAASDEGTAYEVTMSPLAENPCNVPHACRWLLCCSEKQACVGGVVYLVVHGTATPTPSPSISGAGSACRSALMDEGPSPSLVLLGARPSCILVTENRILSNHVSAVVALHPGLPCSGLPELPDSLLRSLQAVMDAVGVTVRPAGERPCSKNSSPPAQHGRNRDLACQEAQPFLQAAMDAVCEAVRSRRRRPFSRTVSERGWLEGARRIWVTMPQDLELLYTRMQRTASRG